MMDSEAHPLSSTEQLLLIPTDVTFLCPVEVEGYRRGRVARMGGRWRVMYWNCACGATLHHNQVVKHLCTYHFYSERDARFVFQQASYYGSIRRIPVVYLD